MSLENLVSLYTYQSDFDTAEALYPEIQQCSQEAIDTIRSLRHLLREEHLCNKEFEIVEFIDLLESLGVQSTAAEDLMFHLGSYLGDDRPVSFQNLEKIEKTIFANDIMENAKNF